MIRRRVESKIIDFNGHPYIDLGLPSGTLWSLYNVGAEASQYESKDQSIPDGIFYNEGNSYNYSDAMNAVESNMGGSWELASYDDWNELLGVITNTTSNPSGGYMSSKFKSNFAYSSQYWISQANVQGNLYPGTKWTISGGDGLTTPSVAKYESTSSSYPVRGVIHPY